MAIANILGRQSLDRNTVSVSKYQNVYVLEHLLNKSILSKSKQHEMLLELFLLVYQPMPMTKKLNTKFLCFVFLLLLQFEKRRDSLASSLFQLRQQQR